MQPITRAIPPCPICGAHYMCQPCTSKKHLEHQELLEQQVLPEVLPEDLPPLIPAPYDGTVIDNNPSKPPVEPEPSAPSPPEDKPPVEESIPEPAPESTSESTPDPGHET